MRGKCQGEDGPGKRKGDGKEIMEEAKREGNSKMWKTIKKVLGCGSYRFGTSKVEK